MVTAVLGTRLVRRAVEVRQATVLFQVVRGDGITPSRALNDAEFDRAVALLETSPAREARSIAAQSAGESAHPPARRDRLADLARRQVDSADPDDRHTGLLLTTILRLTELLNRAKALRRDPDARVRKMATAAVARLAAELDDRRK